MDEKEFKDQFTKFINYCQKHPIDMRIINKLDESTINILRNSAYIKSCYNRNNEYMLFITNLYTYIFQFKNMHSLKIFNKSQTAKSTNNYSFDYDEYSISLNNHDLNYVILKQQYTKEKVIYTFDSHSRHLLIKTDTEKRIALNKDIYDLIDLKQEREYTEYECFANSKWQYFKQDTIPEELKQLILVQRTIATLI